MNDFIGKNYTVPQLDLSVKPENTVEKYAYLYEQTVVDDSESYLGHPDSVLLKNGDILTVYPHGHGKGAVLNKISADGGRSYTKYSLSARVVEKIARDSDCLPPRIFGQHAG